MLNGAPIKGAAFYPDGNLTFADVKKELPFPTKMVTVDMPGHVLQDAIVHSRTQGPEGEERRGYLQVDEGVVLDGSHRIVSINHGTPFQPQAQYIVALPRNLMAGFCNIVPLVEFAAAHPDSLPDSDNFVPALNLVLAHHAKVGLCVCESVCVCAWRCAHMRCGVCVVRHYGIALARLRTLTQMAAGLWTSKRCVC